MSRLSDAANPGTVSVFWAGFLGALVVLMVWRCLIPQWRALRAAFRARRGHRAAMLKASQKRREELPPGQN